MPNFDPDNPNDRTVLNWRIKAEIIQANISGFAFVPSLVDRDQIVDVVTRILLATRAAEQAGRISAGQSAAVLAAWNSSYGTIPVANAAASLLEAVRLTTSQLDLAIGASLSFLQLSTFNSAWV